MTAYLGVSQNDLIASINEGLALLETYSPGPECQKRIDSLREIDAASGQSKIGAIIAAADDVSLATAIRASGINWVFARMGEVLRFHAANDTDGSGAKTHQSLTAWNATGGAMTMEYNRVDEECDSWLALNRAAKVPAAPDTKAKIENYAAAVSQQSDAVKNAVKAIVKLVGGAAAGADETSLKDSFLALSLHERHIVNRVLGAITKEDEKAEIKSSSPLGRYGVPVDALTARMASTRDPAIQEIRKKIEAALDPFYATDEVGMTGIGGVYADRTRNDVGIVFVATARAAQAVADALPELLVTRDNGTAVTPAAPQQGAAPKKGFNL